jgi:hypothetical protein
VHVVVKKIIETIKGIARSLTMWLASVLIVLPDVLTFAQQNQMEFVKLLPVELQSQVTAWLGVAVFLARLRSIYAVARVAAEKAKAAG